MALSVDVVGASTDTAEKNQEFRDQRSLHFPLLSDPDGEGTKALGILSDKGRAMRTTFLVDAQGIVSKVWEQVSIDGHEEEVLAAARGL